MHILNQLFGFSGRAGRLAFFFSIAFSFLTMIAAFAGTPSMAISGTQGELEAAYSFMTMINAYASAPATLIFLCQDKFVAIRGFGFEERPGVGLMAACVFALSLWVNLAAQVKRCREAFGGLTWFWVNLAQSIVCTMFPLLLLVSVRFSLVYYGVLFSKPANLKSRDGTMPRDPATDATASRTSREHRASGGLAAMSTEELRARAAQLQEPEEPAREVQLFPPPVPSHSAGSVPVPLTHEAGQHQTRRVFGRR